MALITVILASAGKNKELAEVLIQEIEQNGVRTDLIDLLEIELPMYTSIYETDWGVPEKVYELHARLKKSNGILFVSPEYNGGVPPILSNLIAWVSRLGDDWRLAFNAKPAALATHSGSSGINMLNALRTQLSYLGMNVQGRQIVTTLKKPLTEDTKKAVIDGLAKCARLADAT